MDTIIMQKAQLTGILTENRNKHRKVFLEALSGYRRQAIAELEKSLEEARKGKRIRRTITLVEPQDMTKAYDTTLAMLAHHQENTIEITREEYRNYVLDEWQWSSQWSASNRAYTSSASSEEYWKGKGYMNEGEFLDAGTVTGH
jgi:hypothetical protein